MIAPAHFRRGGTEGREPLAAPGDLTSLAAKFTACQGYWGKITSKRPEPYSKGDIELAAFHLGVKPATLRQALNMGIADG